MTASRTWAGLIYNLFNFGQKVQPRGQATRELVGYRTSFKMEKPIVSVLGRKMGFKFMAAEAAWILSGNDDVASIAPYSREISKFSDDGERFFGAYGPRLIDQFDYVVQALKNDKDSRQAVITIWRQNPPMSRDIPCTVALQWLIRDNKLYCIDFMRSSDAWLGWPYDVFNFSMVSACILLELRALYPALELGELILFAGSQHLYERNYEAVTGILDGAKVILPQESYEEFMPELQFHTKEQLIEDLWIAAKTDGALKWAQRGYSHGREAND